MQRPEPMTLANMRANGVRSLDVSCLGNDCHHHAVIDASGLADDLTVPSFGPRMRCQRCGRLGADVRPNWNDRRAIGVLTGR